MHRRKTQPWEVCLNNYDTFNEFLVTLFYRINHFESNAVITEEFRDITMNDMHIIDAIGIQEKKSMSAVAKDLSVTVGTLTTTVNNLLKKGYVRRTRSEADRRVVLLSLTAKGRKAYHHHRQFHEDMIQSMLAGMNENEIAALKKALDNLSSFFQRDSGKPRS